MAGVIRISAPHDGYRRAGLGWHREPQEVDIDTLRPDQLQALRAGFRLTIEEIAAPSTDRPLQEVTEEALRVSAAVGASLPLTSADMGRDAHTASKQLKKSKGK